MRSTHRTRHSPGPRSPWCSHPMPWRSATVSVQEGVVWGQGEQQEHALCLDYVLGATDKVTAGSAYRHPPSLARGRNKPSSSERAEVYPLALRHTGARGVQRAPTAEVTTNLQPGSQQERAVGGLHTSTSTSLHRVHRLERGHTKHTDAHDAPTHITTPMLYPPMHTATRSQETQGIVTTHTISTTRSPSLSL